ncbi:MAG: type II toxin-antitoxin system RelE/ParE family toxin [Dehalococcoidia bacterium]
MYEIRLARSANRYYQRVDVDTARRLERCFEELSRNPFTATNVRPIRGRQGVYRYRVGDLRVIFTVVQVERVVRVTAIGPRGNVYEIGRQVIC